MIFRAPYVACNITKSRSVQCLHHARAKMAAKVLEAFACDAGASATFPTNQDDPCSRVVKQILNHLTPFWILFTTLLLLAATIAVDCSVTLPSGTRQTHCLWYETCWALKTAAFCSTFHPIIEPLICTESHSQVPGFGPLGKKSGSLLPHQWLHTFRLAHGPSAHA